MGRVIDYVQEMEKVIYCVKKEFFPVHLIFKYLKLLYWYNTDLSINVNVNVKISIILKIN